MMRVNHKITDRVAQGELVATQVNIFGEQVEAYNAPEDGIVIGHCVNPIGQTGARIIHLGVLMDAQGIERFVKLSGCSPNSDPPGCSI